MNTQLPASKVYVGLTKQGEYTLKQVRCNERWKAAAKWFERWQAVINKDKREVA